MTLINLPRTNQTGPNEWEDVEANDRAIANVVNGQLTDENIRDGADISGLKLADGTIPTAKLTDQAVTTAKLMDQAVTSAKLMNQAVTSEKLADQAVTTAKLTSQAVTSGKLKFATGTTNSAAPVFLTGGDDLVASMSLSPGIYLVQGVAHVVALTGGADVWLAHSGGAATRQPSEDVAPAVLEDFHALNAEHNAIPVSAIYTVTQTTSLRLYARRRTGSAGAVYHAGLAVFGFAAT